MQRLILLYQLRDLTNHYLKVNLEIDIDIDIDVNN